MVWLYKHLNNETIVYILMFSFCFFVFVFWFFGFEVLYFIFIVEKDKTKVLKFNMTYSPYRYTCRPLLSAAL